MRVTFSALDTSVIGTEQNVGTESLYSCSLYSDVELETIGLCWDVVYRDLVRDFCIFSPQISELILFNFM